MLDRVGDEVAVATSIVRYAPGSAFPAHGHALGEEFIVLEGEFADEYGRYAAGTYVRNPPGTRHSPFSDPGCVIFVKLRQFDPEDQQPCTLVLDTGIPEQGSAARELYRYGDEVVQEIVAAADVSISCRASQIQELLVLEGCVRHHGTEFGPWGWIRTPAGSQLMVTTLIPARLFVKTRPLYREP